MFEIKMDEDEMKELYLQELRKRLDKIEGEALLMSLKDVTEYLGVSRSTFNELFLHNSDLPRIKIGRSWRFYRPQVDAFIEQFVNNVQLNHNGQAYQTIKKVKAKKEERESLI